MKGARKAAPHPEKPHPVPVRPAHGGSGDAQHLIDGARRLIRARKAMAAYIPPGLIKDWAWNMLLELFVNSEAGTLVYVKQLILASGASPPSAMRLIDRLEEANIIRRLSDPMDSRRVIVTLSERGREAMLTLLRSLFEPSGSRNAEAAPAANRC